MNLGLIQVELEGIHSLEEHSGREVEMKDGCMDSLASPIPVCFSYDVTRLMASLHFSKTQQIFLDYGKPSKIKLIIT